MRLLIANPNTSQSITDRIARTAGDHASTGTIITAVTATSGPPYIATRAEAVLGAAAVLDLLAHHAHDADAVIIAAFADPGLGAARELLSIPVVGMAEAAMLTACMLGRRFAVLTFAVALEPWYQETLDYNALGGRSAGIFCLDEPFTSIENLADEKAEALVRLCNRAVAAGADVCILGGAPLAGLAHDMADRVPVPLVDGVGAAVRQAEVLVGLGYRKPSAGTFRRPAPKPLTGVSVAMQRLFNG